MKADTLRKDYTGEAESYDRSRFESPSGLYLSRCDGAVVRGLVARTKEPVLFDLPVGTGRVLEYVEPLGVKVIGGDLTQGMLRIARDRPVKNRVGVLKCDGARLPFADASVGLVVSLNFFHLFHASDRPPFAREYDRILRPGGHLLCNFTNGWYGGGLNWIRRSLHRLGLSHITAHFESFGERKRLFPGWSVVAQRGNFLPLQNRVRHLGPAAERAALWFTARAPFNRLCYARYYLLQKPSR